MTGMNSHNCINKTITQWPVSLRRTNFQTDTLPLKEDFDFWHVVCTVIENNGEMKKEQFQRLFEQDRHFTVNVYDAQAPNEELTTSDYFVSEQEFIIENDIDY